MRGICSVQCHNLYFFYLNLCVKCLITGVIARVF